MNSDNPVGQKSGSTYGMSEHPSGVETRDLIQGYQGVAHHGDGTCTKTWAPTEDMAERRAGDLL